MNHLVGWLIPLIAMRSPNPSPAARSVDPKGPGIGRGRRRGTWLGRPGWALGENFWDELDRRELFEGFEKQQIMLVAGPGPSRPEKYEFVNWDDEVPNIWENKKWQPNHQPENEGDFFRIWEAKKNMDLKKWDLTSSTTSILAKTCWCYHEKLGGFPPFLWIWMILFLVRVSKKKSLGSVALPL